MRAKRGLHRSPIESVETCECENVQRTHDPEISGESPTASGEDVWEVKKGACSFENAAANIHDYRVLQHPRLPFLLLSRKSRLPFLRKIPFLPKIVLF